MPAARYKTAGSIVLAAGRELGLGIVADPYASTEDTWLQLTAMLNAIGRELADTYIWENLTREYTFQTQLGVGSYALPVDMNAMIDETGWDRTAALPLRGPLTAEEWQTSQARPLVSALPLAFRLNPNTIDFTPTASVPDQHTVAFELRSLAWANPAASGLGTGVNYGRTLGTSGLDECVATGDYPLYDPLMLRYALKLWWKKDRGFDTTSAEADFVRALENAKGRTRGARALSVTGGIMPSILIGDQNLPWP